MGIVLFLSSVSVHALELISTVRSTGTAFDFATRVYRRRAALFRVQQWTVKGASCPSGTATVGGLTSCVGPRRVLVCAHVLVLARACGQGRGGWH